MLSLGLKPEDKGTRGCSGATWDYAGEQGHSRDLVATGVPVANHKNSRISISQSAVEDIR